MKTSACGVIVLLGPGADELERAGDLLDSLAIIEPAVQLLLVADGRDPEEVGVLQAEWPGRMEVLTPPPRKRWTSTPDRISFLVRQAFARASQLPQCRYWIKMDVDALVIAPFVKRLQVSFEQDSSLGMIGSYLFWPGGKKRPTQRWHGHHLESVCQRFALLPDHLPWATRLYLGFGKYFRRRLPLLRARLDQPGDAGRHINGGSYAVRMEAMSAMARAGLLQDPKLFDRTGLNEDLLMSIFVEACGFHLADETSPGAVFAVQWKGLADSPDRLMQDSYSIIHSVKNDPEHTEAEIRTFFQQQRQKGRP